VGQVVISEVVGQVVISEVVGQSRLGMNNISNHISCLLRCCYVSRSNARLSSKGKKRLGIYELSISSVDAGNWQRITNLFDGYIDYLRWCEDEVIKSKMSIADFRKVVGQSLEEESKRQMRLATRRRNQDAVKSAIVTEMEKCFTAEDYEYIADSSTDEDIELFKTAMQIKYDMGRRESESLQTQDQERMQLWAKVRLGASIGGGITIIIFILSLLF